jgi:hypothetical protein
MLKSRHTIIATCGVCAAIVIGSAPNSWGTVLPGRVSGAVPTAYRQPGSALTNEQIAALAEIQQAATEAGLHPAVFGPQKGATVEPGSARGNTPPSPSRPRPTQTAVATAASIQVSIFCNRLKIRSSNI